MILRFLAIFLVFAVAGAFGQTGLFGVVSIRLKAGDLAPRLSFAKIVGTASEPPNLIGKLTVLAFFPDTSHNLQQTSRWNELIGQFSGQPVQFVWITAEAEKTLGPWLEQHPMNGPVLIDSEGLTGRSFGMEMPSAVLIGRDGRIIGYDGMMVPTADTLNAALEDRVTTAMPNRDMAELMEFAKSRKVLLSPEPSRMPRADDHKPDFEPSYIVHIAPVKDEDRGNFSGPDYYDLKSFTLKALIAELYDVTPARIQIPASLDDGKRYEAALVLPERETKEQMYARFRQGIEDYFHISATRQKRSMNVYVVTAPNGKPPAVAPSPDDEDLAFFKAFRASSVEYQSVRSLDAKLPEVITLDSIRGISMEGTMEEFCQMFENQVDRPVVDESNLKGEYEFRVAAGQTPENDFLQRLHDQLGLSITPAQRTVEVLVIQPRN